ncbi:MAG: metallophosphoesterase [Betaproteobacteria bacterium]|nr:metallophosphoesterase [Betaproteobacteria bacterium]
MSLFTCSFRAVAVLLLGCAPLSGMCQDAETFSAYVVLGENGVPVARVLTSAAQCPQLNMDGRAVPMHLRADAQTMPLRSTLSAPSDSKPSAFPLLTCELEIPPHTATAQVEGRALPLPRAEIKRIVVIGDTGCRLKKSDKAYQACNDPEQYPFAKVAAAAAAWKPDLVIHVGDYHYRENACPQDKLGCAGSPWGYGWDAWREDFFKPAAPLLQAAPWIVTRGNHESCARAGQGWWRLLDPRALLPGRDCNDAANDDIGDYSDPYAVPLGGDAQVIVLDTSNTTGQPIPQDDIRAAKYRDLYRKLDALSQRASYNIGVNHHPILGFAAKRDGAGKVALLPGNQGLQSVLSALDPLLLPPRVNAMLSGHVHVWQEVSFATPHPTQFVTGFSGTQEDIVPLPEILSADATPAVGAVVEQHSSWVNGFGFMTLERSGASAWDVKVWDSAGHAVNVCRIEGRKSVCDVAQVKQ